MTYVAASSLESNCRALQIYGARLGRKSSPTARRARLIAESVYAAAPEFEFAITQSGCAIRVGRTLKSFYRQREPMNEHGPLLSRHRAIEPTLV
jgi:hypothetical protein